MRLSDYPAEALTPAEQSTQPSTNNSNQYLSFNLGQERYAVDILHVQEIRRFDTVTLVPDAPAYIKGVINLRGVIVPVMDLRLKLNMPPAKHNPITVMIVLTIGARIIGIVVDNVCDVIELKSDAILPPPQFTSLINPSMISGISTLDDTMIMVLNSERLIAYEDSNDATTKTVISNHSSPTEDDLII